MVDDTFSLIGHEAKTKLVDEFNEYRSLATSTKLSLDDRFNCAYKSWMHGKALVTMNRGGALDEHIVSNYITPVATGIFAQMDETLQAKWQSRYDEILAYR